MKFTKKHENADETVMQYVRRNPYLIVLRSLTKFYALAGLRIGFGIFPLKVAQEMKKYKEPWTINSLADAAARAALQDSGYQAKSLATMQREKRFIEKSLRQAGISFVPSEANYYLIRISNASAVIRTLTRKGILSGTARILQVSTKHIYALRSGPEERMHS